MKSIIALLFIALIAVPCMAAEQFVGIGGGIDLNDLQDSAFDFSWGYELAEGQWIATTLRVTKGYTEFTEDFIQEVVDIEPLGLGIVGLGSVGATAGDGLAKFDFGGGIGGMQDLSKFSDKLKNCSLFIGAKFMRNDFTEEDKTGGVSRLIFEFVYRFGE